MAEEQNNQAGEDNAGVRFPPPFIFLGMLLLGLALDAFVFKMPFAADPTLAIIAALLLGASALFLFFSAAKLFKKAGNDPAPWTPIETFVAEGVYLKSRNPMYLGMAFLYLALTFYFQSWGMILLFIPLIWLVTHFVIKAEEAYMARRFGAAYLDYKSKVSRWIKVL